MNSFRPAPGAPGSFSLFTLVAIGCLWSALIYQLSAQWSIYAHYSYGWFVPFLCLALAWSAGLQIPVHPASKPLGGHFILVSVSILFLPTWIIAEANPIWRAASYLLTIEVVLLSLTLVWLEGGWPWVRKLAFPASFILLAVPWPSSVEQFVIQSLTGLNTAATVEILGWIGIPALQHGNVIELSGGRVGIDEACSGVRSIQAVLLMTLFFAAFNKLSVLRSAYLVGFGVLLAMVCNLGRTTFLSFMASKNGNQAIDQWHDPAGICLLLTCFVGVWAAAEIFERHQDRQTADETRRAIFSPQVSLPLPQFDRSFGLVPILLVIWILGSLTASHYWFKRHETMAASHNDWAVAWPTNQIDFRELPIAPSVHSQLQCDIGQSRRWTSGDQTFWHAFFFQWNRSTSLARRATVHLAKTHRPEHCLVASGKELVHQDEPEIVTVKSLSLPYRHLEFSDNGVPLHVFFIAWEEGTPPTTYANMRGDSASRLRAAWDGNRGNGQRVLEIAVWGISDPLKAKESFVSCMKEIIIPALQP